MLSIRLVCLGLIIFCICSTMSRTLTNNRIELPYGQPVLKQNSSNSIKKLKKSNKKSIITSQLAHDIIKRSGINRVICDQHPIDINPYENEALNTRVCLNTYSPYRREDCQAFASRNSLAVRDWPRAQNLTQYCLIHSEEDSIPDVVMQPFSTVVRAWNFTSQTWMKIKVVLAYTCTI